MQKLVRCDRQTRSDLDRLRKQTGLSTSKLIHLALVSYQKALFFGSINKAYQNEVKA